MSQHLSSYCRPTFSILISLSMHCQHNNSLCLCAVLLLFYNNYHLVALNISPRHALTSDHMHACSNVGDRRDKVNGKKLVSLISVAKIHGIQIMSDISESSSQNETDWNTARS